MTVSLTKGTQLGAIVRYRTDQGKQGLGYITPDGVRSVFTGLAPASFDVIGTVTYHNFTTLLPEMRGWLADCDLPVPTTDASVVRRIGLRYEGGVPAFIRALNN